MNGDIAAKVAARVIAFVGRNRAAFFALAATYLFYLPALSNSSIDAGFLYTGDVLGFYWPSLVKLHALISSHHFNAIDFSLFNGSSDFYLTSNFFGVHPLFVLASLLTSPETLSVRDVGRLLVVGSAFHSFVACYFSLKLLTRFFDFEFWPASFVAVGFAFSVYMVNSLSEPQYLFCASMVTWSAYAALDFQFRPTVLRLLFASLPVLVALLAGYIPLGAASLVLAIVLIVTNVFLFGESSKPMALRVRNLIRSLAPFALASLIAAPYLIAAYLFLQESPSHASPSLFFSAHQLAELPQTMLRVLSFHYDAPGPFYEFSPTIGFIGVTIIAVFILNQKTLESLAAREHALLRIAAGVYFLIVLSTLGQFSVVSDLVYYLIPQIGKMHIYQRFLLPGQFFCCLMLVLMLKSIVLIRPMASLRIALVILTAATASAAYIVSRQPLLAQESGINNYIVVELFLGLLFVFTTILPGSAFVYIVALVLFNLPNLDRMYDYSISQNTRAEQQKRSVISLDDSVRAGLVSYLKRFSNKDLIKYVDLTPMWSRDGVETFPKSFPYIVPRELRLSSYHGFNFYLSPREEYMKRMPVRGQNYTLVPDWDWIRNTGADFVVVLGSDMNSGSLAPVIGEPTPADIYRLPNDIVIVPLPQRAGGPPRSLTQIFDNGYFRVSPDQARDETRQAESLNIALRKTATQSSTVAGGDASRAVDGNTNGLFENGSVTHTGADKNAWFEIDLGTVEVISSVRIWNRDDGVGDRLTDYWIFISEKPFLPGDTVDTLRVRTATWGKPLVTPVPQTTVWTGGQRGRYLRIQLGGRRPIDVSFLSLAEVQVYRGDAQQSPQSTFQSVAGRRLKNVRFYTNDADYLRLDLESAFPVTVEYLLSFNPRETYLLNGNVVHPVEKGESPIALDLKAGRNTIEIRYRNWPLTIFFFGCGIYGIACLGALLRKSYEYTRNSLELI